MPNFSKGENVGSYVLDKKLGEGGWGEVWLARHPTLSKKPPVAIKFLLHLSDTMLVRFKQEAVILDKLRDNPHIITVEDYAQHRGVPYLLMQYAPRGNLAERIGNGLSPEVVANYLTQVADALDFAHAQGIIHRDVKPSNVLFDGQNRLLLSDFGIAHDDSKPSTNSDDPLRTPEYSAPEQFKNAKVVTAAADIYALGAMTFQLLTGHYPFGARPLKSGYELAFAHFNTPVPKLESYRVGLPRGLQAVIEKAMAKEASERYQTAKAFAMAFERALVPEKPTPLVPPTEPYSENERIGNPPPNPVKPPQYYYPNPSPLVYPPVNPRIEVEKPRAYQPPQAEKPRPPRRRIKLGWLAGIGLLVVSVIAALLILNASGGRATPTPIAEATATAIPVTSTPISTTTANPIAEATTIPPAANASSELLHTLTGYSGGVNSVAFSPDGKNIASGSTNGSIKLWDSTTDKLLNTLIGHYDTVYSVTYSPDGKTLASGSYDNSIKLWDVASGKLLNTLTYHTMLVSSVAYNPDGKTLASGSWDKTIKLWDSATGKLLNTLSGHSSYVNSVAFSPDGKTLASGSYDNSIKLWDSATGKELRILSGHSAGVISVAFSPDGKTLASGSYDNSIKLWDVSSGNLINTLSGHSAGVRSVAFSPDGKTLASGSYIEIRLWDTATGNLINTLSGHSGWIISVAYSPDGKTLASGSDDTTIKLWDATLP